MNKDAEKNEATENEVAENETAKQKSAKKSNKQAVILAACILALALLLQGGYYVRIYLSRTIEIGPFASRRYGTIHAVSADTPYVDTKIRVPEGYTRAKAFYYFKEIALMDEGRNHKDTVRKWTTPILFYVEGDPDDLVENVLQEMFEKLNDIKGFPGITQVFNKEEANLIGYFYYDEQFVSFGREYGANKFVHGLNYLELNENDSSVKTGFIALRMELPVDRKKKVLREELVQALGLQNDSYAYPDSLFYQNYNEVQELSALDWILVRILYHPLIQPGMNYNQCFPILSIIIDH